MVDPLELGANDGRYSRALRIGVSRTGEATGFAGGLCFKNCTINGAKTPIGSPGGNPLERIVAYVRFGPNVWEAIVATLG